MTGLLSREDRDKFGKLLGMCGSAHDGERASAALKIDGLLKRAGVTGTDLANALVPRPGHGAPLRPSGMAPVSPSMPHQRRAFVLLTQTDWLTDWERGFLDSIRHRRSISNRQDKTLSDIERSVIDKQRRAGA